MLQSDNKCVFFTMETGGHQGYTEAAKYRWLSQLKKGATAQVGGDEVKFIEK